MHLLLSARTTYYSFSSICRNVPDDEQPLSTANTPALFNEVQRKTWDPICLVVSDGELFASTQCRIRIVQARSRSIDRETKKRSAAPYIDFVADHIDTPIFPQGKQNHMRPICSKSTAFCTRHVYWVAWGKRSSFQEQLIVPRVLRTLLIQAGHDLPASGVHLACRTAIGGPLYSGGCLDPLYPV